jgi:hypothetical protein
MRRIRSPQYPPRRPLARLWLEILEDRLPPGNLLAAGAFPPAADPFAASDLALVQLNQQKREQEPLSNLRPPTASAAPLTALSFPLDQPEAAPDAVFHSPTAVDSGMPTFLDAPLAGKEVDQLFAAFFNSGAAGNPLPAGDTNPQLASAAISGFNETTASSLPPNQALLEALAAPAGAAPVVQPAPHANAGAITPAAPNRQALAEAYGRLPLSFEANQGQTDPQVHFLARGSGYALFLTDSEAVLSLQRPGAPNADDQPADTAVLRMQLLGARNGVEAVGQDEQPGRVNYFIGDDPSQWRTDIPTFGRVAYPNVYDGISLIYYGNQQQLEYDFVVAPGADAHAVALNFTGAEQVRIDSAGNLVLDTAAGSVMQHRPYLYQEVNGVRQEVAGGYEMQGEHQVGFTVGAYDATRPLIIDPVLSYSSYLGGSGFDYAYAVALDGSNNAYLTGETASTNFPTTTPFQPSFAGGLNDAFVTKINAAGTARVYSTYLGGSNSDRGSAIAVDAGGNAYVTGRTNSPAGTGASFPTTAGALLRTARGGQDAFVTKLNAAGNALVYSTYLGGAGNDSGFGIAVDGSGNAHVTGGTSSDAFPISADPFYDHTLPTGTDAFYTKLNATGSAVLYSTYLGGDNPDRGNSIALDGSGNAYIAGQAYSANLPTTPGVFQPAVGGGSGIDGFIAKFNPNLGGAASLVYLTYIGGSGSDFANGIAVDGGGNAYVTGETDSTNFPVQNPIQANFGGGFNDAWVAKINATATAKVYATYLGGGGDDRGNGIALDSAGNAYVTGFTNSTDYPTVRAVQPTNAGGYDAFVTKVNAAGSALAYSTYLGGSMDENQISQGDNPCGIAVDGSGNAYVAGRTASSNFPTVAAFQPASGGTNDAFLAKIVDDPAAALSVSGVALTPTGFIADFNRPIDQTVLNLYDGLPASLGPADVTVTGTTTGLVSGSLLVDPSGTRITFIQTGGVLAPDTYTVRLRSAADAFKDTSGGLLDGNRDGTPGDDFVRTFTVSASSAVVVSIPDFARGPGQPVDVPATSMRLPVQVSNGLGITSLSMTIAYNPALLTLTSATVGAGLPAGAAVNLILTSPGRAVLNFSSPTALPAGAATLATLSAAVPTAAPNGASHLLDIGNLTINFGAIVGRDDDGLHLVAFFGDATGNGAYTSADAQRVLRVAVGLDTGFAPYPRTSPLLVGDITGNGTLNSIDATRVLQFVVGIPTPQIPPLP